MRQFKKKTADLSDKDTGPLFFFVAIKDQDSFTPLRQQLSYLLHICGAGRDQGRILVN